MVACSIASTRLDYCNALRAGVSENLHRLQLIQNTQVRVVTGTGRQDHITQANAELHWLPVRARMTFKSPYWLLVSSYIADLITDYKLLRELKSLLIELVFTAETARRFFSYSAVRTWNGPPDYIMTLINLSTFRKNSKLIYTDYIVKRRWCNVASSQPWSNYEACPTSRGPNSIPKITTCSKCVKLCTLISSHFIKWPVKYHTS